MEPRSELVPIPPDLKMQLWTDHILYIQEVSVSDYPGPFSHNPHSDP